MNEKSVHYEISGYEVEKKLWKNYEIMNELEISISKNYEIMNKQ